MYWVKIDLSFECSVLNTVHILQLLMIYQYLVFSVTLLFFDEHLTLVFFHFLCLSQLAIVSINPKHVQVDLMCFPLSCQLALVLILKYTTNGKWAICVNGCLSCLLFVFQFQLSLFYFCFSTNSTILLVVMYSRAIGGNLMTASNCSLITVTISQSFVSSKSALALSVILPQWMTLLWHSVLCVVFLCQLRLTVTCASKRVHTWPTLTALHFWHDTTSTTRLHCTEYWRPLPVAAHASASPATVVTLVMIVVPF